MKSNKVRVVSKC